MPQKTDTQEPVSVTLTLEDWAQVVIALGNSQCKTATKARITTVIFTSAEKTERILS